MAFAFASCQRPGRAGRRSTRTGARWSWPRRRDAGGISPGWLPGKSPAALIEQAALWTGVLVAAGVVQLLCVCHPGSSPIQVAAAPPAVGLRPHPPLQLHQAPDLGAVRTEVGLDVGGQLADDGQVDAQQLCAPLQRRRDWPAQLRVVPGPRCSKLPKHMFGRKPGSPPAKRGGGYLLPGRKGSLASRV